MLRIAGKKLVPPDPTGFTVFGIDFSFVGRCMQFERNGLLFELTEEYMNNIAAFIYFIYAFGVLDLMKFSVVLWMKTTTSAAKKVNK